MLQGAPVALPPGAPHVIVVGNEKGGVGKTTIAMHLAVGLLKLCQRVSTIDLDSTQRSLTRYIENRRIRANYRRIELKVPAHRYVSRVQSPRPVENEADELAALETAISSFDRSTDFLVIDTPSNDTYLMRLAHLMADTVLTPLPDSFLDFGMLASIDPITQEVTGTGPYAAMMLRSPPPAPASWRGSRRLGDCPQPLLFELVAGPEPGQAGNETGIQGYRGLRGANCISPILPFGLDGFRSAGRNHVGGPP